MVKKIKTSPSEIFKEYTAGADFKAGIGDKGICEQAKINERFYVGDHWHGAKCGADRPLVRRNIIRRIADYKLSCIGSAPLVVNFNAEGIATNTVNDSTYKSVYEQVVSGKTDFSGATGETETAMVMDFLTSYGNSTAERLKFDSLAAEALKNAYTSGTGILYTYWDSLTETGLYADKEKNVPIKGDIACQVLEIENVVFGDPNCADTQRQPYIIIASRRDADDVIREARRNGMPAEIIEKIKPDNDTFYTGLDTEPSFGRRVTVYTKFYKEWNKEGSEYKVMCVKCTADAVIRRPFDTGVKLYPLAVMRWDSRKNSAYGESEITYLIPNQIAVNRALSAQVWSLMLNGMPIMVVNGDIVDNITNDPGQIIKVFGSSEDMMSAVRYIQPPSFAGQMISGINDLASNTLSDSGANDAALGNVRPDNAAAIIQMREAALQPLQLKQSAYYAFIEEVMRIWAEFWLNLYGDRRLKISTPTGVAYVPFHASRYGSLLINAKVDVGASTLWSQSVVVSTLDSLLAAKVITPQQYLERVPENIIPNKTGLINELKQLSGGIGLPEKADEDILKQLADKSPEGAGKYQQLPPEKQQELLEIALKEV